MRVMNVSLPLCHIIRGATGRSRLAIETPYFATKQWCLVTFIKITDSRNTCAFAVFLIKKALPCYLAEPCSCGCREMKAAGVADSQPSVLR
jgi:hypothetical protein